MVDPALDAGIELGEADLAGVIGGQPRPEPAVGRAHLAGLDQSVRRIDDEAEPRNSRADRQHLRARLVNDQAQPGEPLDDGRRPPSPNPREPALPRPRKPTLPPSLRAKRGNPVPPLASRAALDRRVASLLAVTARRGTRGSLAGMFARFSGKKMALILLFRAPISTVHGVVLQKTVFTPPPRVRPGGRAPGGLAASGALGRPLPGQGLDVGVERDARNGRPG